MKLTSSFYNRAASGSTRTKELEMPDNDDTADQQVAEPTKPSQATLQPLRVWPVIVFIAGMILARWTNSIVDDGPEMLWMVPAFVPALCGALILVWWLTFSRASWQERLGGFVGLLAIIVGTVMVSHPTIPGPAMTVVTIPIGFGAFGLALFLQAKRMTRMRTVAALVVASLAFGFSGLLRADGGLRGDFSIALDWRWRASGEEKFLADADSTASADSIDELEFELNEPDWPGFRGVERNAVVRGVNLSTDWKKQPPETVWKVRVGPGWSSFAVAGDLLFTQEQRGDSETVVCYNAANGNVVWTHSEEGRLEDPLGGPGPRATPQLSNGALFVVGATRWLMRLKPDTGDVAWKVDLQDAAGRKPPEWGFCASPLVVNNHVVVYTLGDDERGLTAFDADTGAVAWSAPAGDHAYGSAQLFKFGERDVIGLSDNKGVALYDPQDGAVLMTHEWKVDGYRCLQPIMTPENQLLIPTGIGFGTRCLQLSSDGDKIGSEVLWTSRDLKGDFSDCVLFDGHIYGFDGSIFACIELKTGKRKWKRGRYGKGQVLMVADSKALIVLSETGDVVLLAADPKRHKEYGSVKAIEGKTWNHPVLVGDRLYVRNSEEAACLKLPLAGS